MEQVKILENLPENWFQLSRQEELLFEKAIAGEALSKMTTVHLGKAPSGCNCHLCRFKRK